MPPDDTQQAVESNATSSQYSVGPIPYHVHDVVDGSPRVAFLDLNDVSSAFRSYYQQGGNLVMVNSTATGVVFGVPSFVGITSKTSSGVLTLSVIRVIEAKVVGDASAVTTGDGQLFICIPTQLNGYTLTEAAAFVSTASSSGGLTIQVRNSTTTNDMLTTAITIDQSVLTSYASATQPVIDPANNTVVTGTQIAIDVDGAGSGAEGLGVMLTFSNL